MFAQKRSIKSLLIAMTICTLLQPLLPVPEKAAAAGSGTIADPYIIMTAADLDNMRNNLSAHYKLGTNIDLSGYSDWQAIAPGGGLYFTGSLDGDGKVITGMKSRCDQNTEECSLLGVVENAVVQNIGLEQVDIVSTQRGTAALIDDMEGGVVRKSYATGSITTSNGGTGGLVNVLVEGAIENSYAQVSVTSTSDAGGLVGALYDGSITNSYAAGPVSGGTGDDNGGLVGEADGHSITSSYYDQEVAGQSDTGKGIPKTTVEMKQQSTFSNWDFATVWKIDEGNDYPKLQLFASAPVEHTVTYDANGASGTVPVDGGSPYEEGETVTVQENSGNLSKAGYTFAGWNTAADGTGPLYEDGDTFSMGSEDMTLYAKWESDNADLDNLTLSDGTLSPSFASAVTSYTASVDNSTESVIVTPELSDAKASATVNGQDPSAPVNLSIGDNEVTVKVTAENGTEKIYIITVTRHLVKGDGDGDGKVTSADSLLVYQWIAGKVQLTSLQQKALDMDGDGDVDKVDAVLILKAATVGI